MGFPVASHQTCTVYCKHYRQILKCRHHGSSGHMPSVKRTNTLQLPASFHLLPVLPQMSLHVLLQFPHQKNGPDIFSGTAASPVPSAIAAVIATSLSFLARHHRTLLYEKTSVYVSFFFGFSGSPVSIRNGSASMEFCRILFCRPVSFSFLW